MRAPLSVRRNTAPHVPTRAQATHAVFVEQQQAPTARSCDLQETLVADVRAELTPSQMVENKLLSALNRVTVLVSQVRSRCLGGSRRRG